MACRLVSAKPLSEPMLEYCWFDLRNIRPFCLGLNVSSKKSFWNYNRNDIYERILSSVLNFWVSDSDNTALEVWSFLSMTAVMHGGPSEAGDCSHPPPKMATAKNASSCKATFDHVIGIGSLRFLACEQVLDIANPWYSNELSSRDSLASRGTRIFQREAGDSMARDRRRRVTHGWEAGDSYFRFNFCELLFRCHTQY